MNGLHLLLWIVGLLFLYGMYLLANARDNAPLVSESDPAGISRFDAADGVGWSLADAAAHEARMMARAERIGGAS
jgi:hypothetical protein